MSFNLQIRINTQGARGLAVAEIVKKIACRLELMMLLFLMGRLLWRFLRLLSQTTWVTQSRYCFALSFSQYVYSTLVSVSDFRSCVFTGNHISGMGPDGELS